MASREASLSPGAQDPIRILPFEPADGQGADEDEMCREGVEGDLQLTPPVGSKQIFAFILCHLISELCTFAGTGASVMSTDDDS